MATVVQISGHPGSGKTFAASTLDPTKTYIIQADKKGLPWKGWKKQYNKENRNYAETSDVNMVYKYAKGVSEQRPEVTAIVIDTLNSIMSDYEMAQRKVTGFDKWSEMAGGVYDLLGLLREIQNDNLIIFVMAHIEPYDVEGETFWRTKTNGQKLTKLNLNSRLNYNLYTHVDHNPLTEKSEYFLHTQSNGKNEARSAHEVLPYKMPNDLEAVRKAIIESES